MVLENKWLPYCNSTSGFDFLLLFSVACDYTEADGTCHLHTKVYRNSLIPGIKVTFTARAQAVEFLDTVVYKHIEADGTCHLHTICILSFDKMTHSTAEILQHPFLKTNDCHTVNLLPV